MKYIVKNFVKISMFLCVLAINACDTVEPPTKEEIKETQAKFDPTHGWAGSWIDDHPFPNDNELVYILQVSSNSEEIVQIKIKYEGVLVFSDGYEYKYDGYLKTVGFSYSENSIQLFFNDDNYLTTPQIIITKVDSLNLIGNFTKEANIYDGGYNYDLNFVKSVGEGSPMGL